MDYNSVVDPMEGDLSYTASMHDLNLKHIISLAYIYAPSLTISSWIHSVPVDPASIFVNFLVSLAPRFSKGAFQQVAINASSNASIPDSVLDVDDQILLSTGSIISTIQLKQSNNKPFRFNTERCDRLFSDDPIYLVLSELASTGAVIDTDPEFVPQCIPEDFRHSEITLTKVYQKHALDSWSKGRGLLLRTETLESTKEIRLLHFSSNHLVFKPTDEFARWCIDPSHRSDDNLPLNGGTAKLLSIQRYQKTWTTTLLAML